jgi:hypothetical protein
VGKPRGRRPGLNRRIILKQIFRNRIVVCERNVLGLRKKGKAIPLYAWTDP